MPLYAGVNGAKKKIEKLYAGINGTTKEITNLYSGVGGTAKEIYAKEFRWKKYALGYDLVSTGETINVTYTLYNYQQTIVNVAEDLSQISFTENGEALFAVGVAKATHITNVYNSATAYSGRYITLNDDGATVKTYAYATGMQREDQTAKKVLCISGKHPDADTLGFTGMLWETQATVAGEYVGAVYAKDLDAYPAHGIYDGYYYIFDGDAVFERYSIVDISEPSAFGEEGSTSAYLISYPILLAKKVRKDSNGAVTGIDTLSVSSRSNLSSNYASYPYSSFSSSFGSTVYKITSVSSTTVKRQAVSTWMKVGEGKGSYISDITGNCGDYPADGMQDGYYYVFKNIVT